MLLSRRVFLCCGLSVIALAGACKGEPEPVMTVHAPAPDSFKVAFETSKGPFVVQVNRAWSPNGADRFYELVGEGFFDDSYFFRVLPDFIVQFGANNDPKRNERWEKKTIADDSVKQSNKRGTLTFAMQGENSRAHQLFVNLSDNPQLDKQGFAPIGLVVSGMPVVDSLYNGYQEAPSYHLIATLGNSYLRRMFPKLDLIRTAKIQ
jgi:peptidyl-prolyl cis-trans isomerase A (cyclophilin A)